MLPRPGAYSGVYSITQADIDAGLVLNTATVQGEDFNSTVVTDISGATITDDNQTETTLCQDQAIGLVKTGVFVDTNSDLCANVSETIDYEFTITNQGNVSLSSILLTDPLVTNAVYTSGDDGDGILQVGETWICNGSYAITQQDIDAGEVVNSASVSGTSPTAVVVSDISGDTVTNDTPTVTDLCQAASIALVKVGTYDDGDCTAAVGDVITYAFSVSNTGNVTLSNVIVDDPLVTMLGGPIVSLAPGAIDTTTYTASYTITQQDIDAGVFSNQATATAAPPTGVDVTDLSGTSTTNDTPTDTPICQSASVALVKVGTYDDGDCTAAVGDVITYAFSVSNTGNVTLSNVIVEDPLVTMLGGPIASLAPGAIDTTSYTASYTITQQDIDAGVFSNQATVTAAPPTGVDVTDLSGTSVDNDTPTDTPICQAASVALVKVGTYDDGDCTAAVGDVITYAFSVSNTGNVTLTNVIVEDPLVTMLGGPIVSLAPGAIDTTTYTASYTITQQDIDAGVFSNQATVTAAPPTGVDVTDLSGTSVDNDTPTDTPICQDPAIALVKQANVILDPTDNCYNVSVGGFIDYTFTVTNQGNVSLSTITLSDALVTTAYVSGDDGDGVLQVSETWIYSGSYAVTQSDIDTGMVTNTATVSGTSPLAVTVTDISGDTITNDVPTITQLCLDSGIAIIKIANYDCTDADGNPISMPGDEILYTFSVKNTGGVTLTNILVTDPLVTVNGGPITLAPGEEDTTTFTAVYIITQNDIDTGFVENQARVEVCNEDNVSDGNCDGQVDYIKLKYLGATQNATIKVIEHDGQTVFERVVQPGEEFEFFGQDPPQQHFGPKIHIYINNTYTQLIHTSCSVAIGIGSVFGDFVVIDGTSRIGGPFIPVVLEVCDIEDLSDDGSYLQDDPTVTDLCQGPSIALVKEGSYNGFDSNGNCIAAVGDIINYTFTVTNTGNVTLTNVIVEDPLVTISGVAIATLAPGAIDTTSYTASYVITQQDIDAGLFTNQATATGTAPDTTIVTDLSGTTISNNTPTVTDICQNDAIAITKAGVFNDVDVNGCSSLGVDTVTYTFTVTNQGNTSLTSVTVTDPLLGGLLTATPTGDTNNNTILDITETWVYVQDYVITQSDIDTGSITNQATASGTGAEGVVTDLSGATVSDDIPTVTIVPASCFDAIAITKTGVFNDVDANGCTSLGVDTVTYTFTVTNQGNTSLTSVTVTDPLLGGLLTALPSGDANTNGILEVTETWVYVQDYVVTQSDIDTGSITNQATASGTGVNGLVTDVSGATISDDIPTVTIVPEACLDAIAITKAGVFNDVDTNGCTTALVDTVTYTFTVTNGGNTPLTSVTVTDPLLGGLLTATPTGDTNNNTILDITETWVYVQDYVITQSDIDTGSITNQATASGTGAEGLVTDLSGATVSDDIPTVTIIPESCLDAIAITKTGLFNDVDTSGCTSLGVDTVTYTFTVTNGGNTPLTSVNVTDPLLGGLLTATPTGDINSNGILEVTETWVYVQDYVVTQSDIDTGSITNQATASGTGAEGLVTDLSGATVSDDIPTVTIIPESCLDAIAITKSGAFNDIDTSGCTSLGVDTVTYTFTVTNQGNTPLTSVTVTDPLLGGLLTATPTGDTNNNTILDITETWVYVQDYVITQSDIDTGSITNQATASGTGVNGLVTDLSGATVSDDIPTVTIIPESCLDAIAITKTGLFNDVDTSGCTSLGVDTVTYTFTVTNQGNTSLTSVTVTDPLLGGLLTALPSGDANNDGILEVTETWVYVQDYVVTQSDIDTGSITNQATASGTGVNGLVTDLSGATVSDDIPTVTIIPESCLDAIAITKTGLFNDVDTSGCTSLGVDTVTYTFTVTNGGNTPLTSVNVTDPLLGGLLTATPTGDINSNGILEVTETWVYVQDYVVTQSDIDTGSITNQATASGTGVNGLVTDLSGATVSDDIPTVTIVPEACLDAIAITKAGLFNDIDTSGCTSLGVDTVTYTFTVTNGGNTSLTSVTVTDPLLGGLLTATPTGDINSNGILEVTETWVYVQDYVVTQSDIDAGSITNQATASGTGAEAIVTDLSGATVSDDIPTVTIVPEACLDAIAITKTGVFNDIDTSGCTSLGVDTVTYTFTVTNGGNTPLTSVTVTDPLLGGLLTATVSGDTNNNTILEVTETWVYVQDYVVTQSDIDTGSITNQATASGTGAEAIVTDLSGVTISDDIPTVTILLLDCNEIIANNDFAGPIAGVNIEVENVLNVFNNDTLNGILVEPAEVILSIVFPEPNGYLELNADGSVDLAANTPEGTYQITYQICETALPINCDTAIITVVVEAPLISVTATPQCVDDVPYLNYEIILENFTLNPDEVTIDWKDVNNTIVQTDLDIATSSINADGKEVLEGQLLWPGVVLDVNGNIIDWPGWIFLDGQWIEGADGFEGLRPSAVITVSVNPSQTLVVDYPPATPFCVSRPPGIALIKETNFTDVDSDNNCTVMTGDVINYTFTVSNIGSGDLTNVMVSDLGLNVSGGPITLAEGATDSTTFTAQYVITQEDINAGLFSNQATVVGTPIAGADVTDLSDNDSFTEDDPTITTFCQEDAIAITKTGVFNDVDTSGCSTASVDTVTYTFTVTNGGNTSLTSVTVTDPLLGGLLTATPTGDINSNGILEVTETWVYVQDYVVTQSDIDTGSITNQATASGTGAEGVVTDLSGASISDDIPTVTIVPEACLDAIAITKAGLFNDIDTSGCTSLGVDTVTYTFTVTNQGNTSLTSVTVTDPLLGGLLTATPTGDANGDTILDITETWVYVQDYVVTQSDIDTGSITNQATASGTGAEGVVTDLSGATVSDDTPTVTIVPEACFDAIAITKTGLFNDIDTSGCTSLGVDTVTYTFTVTNQGNTSLTSVTVTDPLLGGLLTATTNWRYNIPMVF